MKPARATVAGVLLCAWSAALLAAQAGQPWVDLRVSGEHVSMNEVARLVPALEGVKLPDYLRLTHIEAIGPLNALKVRFALQSPAGDIQGRATVNASGRPVTARGSLQIRGLELARLLERPQLPDTLTAETDFTLRIGEGGWKSITATFDATIPDVTAFGYTGRSLRVSGRVASKRVTFEGRGAAYGAAVRAKGEVAFGDLLSYDISGSASNVDLERLPPNLPLPRVDSDVSLDFSVAGAREGAHGRLVLTPSVVAGAAVERGTTIVFDTRGEGLDLDASGGVRTLDLQRAGEIFDVEWLQEDRMRGEVTAQFNVAVRNGAIQTVKADIATARLFDGAISDAVIAAKMTDAALAFDARGQFSSINPGVMFQREWLDGELSGSFDANGAIPRINGELAPAQIDIGARVALAGPSTLEDVPLTQGTIVAALSDGSRLAIERAELHSAATVAQLSGVLGLAATVPTNLRYELRSPLLRNLTSKLATPLTGSVQLEGTVTGTDVLVVAGNAVAPQIGFRQVTARKLTARYGLELSRADAAVRAAEAQVDAGAVAIAGWEFGSATADARYQQKRLRFDVETTHPERSLAAAGNVLFHPDHQEVHVTTLNLGTAAGTWRLANGSDATIRYGGDQISIANLRLVAPPDQLITIDGALNDRDHPLQLSVTNVQVADFAPMLGERALRGRLDGTISGDVAVIEEMLRADLRLTRPDASWLAVEASVPAAIVRDGSFSETAPISVTVTSSPMNLSILGLLTDRVTEIGGTFQVDATWEGSLADPDLGGQLLVRDAAFGVPALGTRYHDLDATVLFQPGNVVVDSVRVLDQEGDALSVSGRLPVRELLAGKVTLTVRADGFHVVDNAVAELEANVDVQVAGHMRLPDLTGSITLTDGTIHVDRVLPLTTRRGPPGASRRAGDGNDNGGAIEDGLLADLPVELNLELRAEALLLEGRDLRAGGDLPIGLGNINITTDGDLTLRKTRNGPLHIVGEVETVRGTYTFQNREFELLRGGTIRFTGAADVNPLFDLTAQRTISAVEARVHIGGSFDDPTLELSSTPPLDDSDILSLIVFNQPTIQLAAGERIGLARRAAAIGVGFLTAELSETVSEALGLDFVDIDTGLDQDVFAPVLTVGERFGDLFVRLRQQIGAESTSQVVIEYAVTDWLSLESSIVERRSGARPLLHRVQGSGIDAVFSWEFGAPEAPIVAPDAATVSQKRK